MSVRRPGDAGATWGVGGWPLTWMLSYVLSPSSSAAGGAATPSPTAPLSPLSWLPDSCLPCGLCAAAVGVGMSVGLLSRQRTFLSTGCSTMITWSFSPRRWQASCMHSRQRHTAPAVMPSERPALSVGREGGPPARPGVGGWHLPTYLVDVVDGEHGTAARRVRHDERAACDIGSRHEWCVCVRRAHGAGAGRAGGGGGSSYLGGWLSCPTGSTSFSATALPELLPTLHHGDNSNNTTSPRQ